MSNITYNIDISQNLKKHEEMKNKNYLSAEHKMQMSFRDIKALSTFFIPF